MVSASSKNYPLTVIEKPSPPTEMQLERLYPRIFSIDNSSKPISSNSIYLTSNNNIKLEVRLTNSAIPVFIQIEPIILADNQHLKYAKEDIDLVTNKNYNVNSNSHQVILNTRLLPDGIYHLKVKTTDSANYVNKIAPIVLSKSTRVVMDSLQVDLKNDSLKLAFRIDKALDDKQEISLYQSNPKSSKNPFLLTNAILLDTKSNKEDKSYKAEIRLSDLRLNRDGNINLTGIQFRMNNNLFFTFSLKLVSKKQLENQIMGIAAKIKSENSKLKRVENYQKALDDTENLVQQSIIPVLADKNNFAITGDSDLMVKILAKDIMDMVIDAEDIDLKDLQGIRSHFLAYQKKPEGKFINIMKRVGEGALKLFGALLL